jgi:TRAP-type mannitol/chloroaromatic compound transport system permease small subunit
MGLFLGISRAIDAVTTRIGKVVAWCILAAILISTINAIIRKVFDVSSNSWLEMQWLLFGAVFLLCAPWTLVANEHIRIDIVNNLLPKWLRNFIDVVGHLFFLIPMTIVLAYTSRSYFWKSLISGEQSMNAGGLPQWPGKALIFFGFVLLFFQGISELIKRLAIMAGKLEDVHAAGGHAAAAEAEAERLLQVAREEAEVHARAQAEALARARAAQPTQKS